MTNSMSKNTFSYQMEELVRDFVKEKLELIMKEEMKNYFEIENPDLVTSKNGSYKRNLDTRYGKIVDLSVPRASEAWLHTDTRSFYFKVYHFL